MLAHGTHFLAFWIFLAAILTDLVDGWLARTLDARGEFGEWLDPVCDKVLSDFTWLALWAVHWAPTWMVMLALGRDLIVTIVWHVSKARGISWQPSLLGQVALTFEGIALPVFLWHTRWLDVDWPSVGMMLGALSLILSAGSIIEYLARGPQKDANRGMRAVNGASTDRPEPDHSSEAAARPAGRRSVDEPDVVGHHHRGGAGTPARNHGHR